MALRTGGAFYANFADLRTALDRLVAANSLTYVLSIRDSGYGSADEFRPLKVKLAGKRRGARVIHPPGFYSRRPYALQDHHQRRIATAAALLSGDIGGDFGTSVFAMPFPLLGDRERVPLVIEIDGPSFAPHNLSGHLLLEIYAYAVHRNGEIHDYLAQTVELDLARIGSGLRRSGMKLWGSLSLPGGDYVIRVLVRNRMTGARSLSQTQLRVPRPGHTSAAGLAPILVEEAPDWLVVQARQKRQVDYPFVLEGHPFLPSARPALVPGRTRHFYLLGTDLTAATVIARFYRPDGELAATVEPEVATAKELAGTPVEWAETRLLVPALTPGFYNLEIELQTRTTKAVHRASTALTIEG